ncbi:MAG: hypothetical protein IJY44_06145 [Bacteroidaceae bacterium]|nr:hypothetical protein [Bacteroidaceae bacterium]
MNDKKFFGFINAFNAQGGDKVVIKSLLAKKYSFWKWYCSVVKKREAFEECVFTCYLENDKFKEQLLIYENKFKETIERYKTSHWFASDFGQEEGTEDYYARKYHEVRKRQTELALAYIDKVRNPKNVQVQVEVERKPYYEGYSVEKITQLFDFLIKKGFLDCNTSKDEFIYYFTGVGEQPINTLKWCRTNVQLAILIGKLFDTDEKKWHKAEQIFGITHLKSSFFNASDKTFDKSEVNAFIICEFI